MATGATKLDFTGRDKTLAGNSYQREEMVKHGVAFGVEAEVIVSTPYSILD